jgi:hypothetical protein
MRTCIEPNLRFGLRGPGHASGKLDSLFTALEPNLTTHLCATHAQLPLHHIALKKD